MNLEELKSLVASGKRQRYLFFWGHTAKNRKAIGAECLNGTEQRLNARKTAIQPPSTS